MLRVRRAEEGMGQEGHEVEQEEKELVEEMVCVEGEKAEEGMGQEGHKVEKEIVCERDEQQGGGGGSGDNGNGGAHGNGKKKDERAEKREKDLMLELH